MKAKSFVACVLTASALPLAPALAQNATYPSGPQGTGWYGAPSGALPLPQTVPPGYVIATPDYAAESVVVLVPDNSANRDALADQRALDRDPPRADAGRPVGRNWVLHGPSWATNPPAPPS